MPRDPVFPPMQLDFVHIKTPQLIGIVCGVLVFVVTISVVIYLLYASGSLSKLAEELQQPASALPAATKKESNCSPQFQSIPELYDNLIEAMNTLPIKPIINLLTGKTILVRPFDVELDSDVLFNACNGSAVYHESSYDPARLWGWLDATVTSPINKKNGNNASSSNNSVADGYPCASKARFNSLYDNKTATDSIHLVIVDKELNRQIGMINLVENSPKSLSIRIDNIWITPAFQGKKYSHEALMLVMKHLVDVGYRRITAELDERHVIGRKFIERCGFTLEAILRKHKIVQNRNRNTALYVLLNTDWIEVEVKIKTYLGHSLLPEVQKVGGLDFSIKREAMGKTDNSSVASNSTSGEGSKKKNKNKDKKKK